MKPGCFFPYNHTACLPLHLWDNSDVSEALIGLGELPPRDPDREMPDSEFAHEEAHRPTDGMEGDKEKIPLRPTPKDTHSESDGEPIPWSPTPNDTRSGSDGEPIPLSPNLDDTRFQSDEEIPLSPNPDDTRFLSDQEPIEWSPTSINSNLQPEDKVISDAQDDHIEDDKVPNKGKGQGGDGDDEDQNVDAPPSTHHDLADTGTPAPGPKRPKRKHKDADDAPYTAAVKGKGRNKKSKVILTDTEDDSTPPNIVDLRNDIAKANRKKYSINASARIFSSFVMTEVEAIADGSDIEYVGSRPGPGALGSESRPIVVDSAHNPVAFVGPSELLGRFITDPSIFRSMQDPTYRDKLFGAAAQMASKNNPAPNSKLDALKERWKQVSKGGELNVDAAQEFYAANADCEAVENQLGSMNTKYMALNAKRGLPDQANVPAAVQLGGQDSSPRDTNT
jgi:hypothetical protein